MPEPSAAKKLLNGAQVEVRQHEEGLRGSWHVGTVLRRGKRKRFVEYNDLLSEDKVSKLVEEIKTNNAIEGWSDRSAFKVRGQIRPVPPEVYDFSEKWRYGLCVDALYEDAWWEGVLVDNNEDSEQRSVFFPDEGDEQKIHSKKLRLSQNWNEASGSWSIRGFWILAMMNEAFVREGLTLKEVWYHLRQQSDFLRSIGEWTLGTQEMWFSMTEDVISELKGRRIKLPRGSLPTSLSSSTMRHKGRKRLHPQSNSHPSIDPTALHAEAENNGGEKDGKANATGVLEAPFPGDSSIIEFDGKPPKRVKKRKLNSRSCVLPPGGRNLQLNDGHKKTYLRDANRELKMQQQNRAVGDTEAGCSQQEVAQPLASCLAAERDSVHCMKGEREMFGINTTDHHGSAHMAKCTGDQGLSCVSVDSGLPKTITSPLEVDLSESPTNHKDSDIQAGISYEMTLAEALRIGLQDKRSTNLKEESRVRLRNGKLLAINNRSKRISRSGKRENLSKEKLNQMELLSLGWAFQYKRKNGTLATHYTSPAGQQYDSLRKACRASQILKNGQGTIEDNHKVYEARRSSKKIAQSITDAEILSSTHASGATTVLPGSSHSAGKAKKFRRSSKMGRQGKSNGYPLPLTGNAGGPSITHIHECVHVKNSSIQSEPRNKEMTKNNKNMKFSKSRKTSCSDAGFGSRKRKHHGVDDSMQVKKQKPLKRRKKGTLKNSYRMQVRPTQNWSGDANGTVPGTGNRTARSVLSWLIENDAVKENEKIVYLNKKDNSPQGEGRMTRQGIICTCCNKLYTLTTFEAHVGSRLHRPSANIYLEDGRSLLQCQIELWEKAGVTNRFKVASRKRKKEEAKIDSDDFCSVCRLGGTLLLCDRCPSSFHIECIQMEAVPPGKWYCPFCRCASCGESVSENDSDGCSENTVQVCEQCECHFHVQCLSGKYYKEKEWTEGSWLCSEKCSQIFSKLRNLVGKVNHIGDDLSWILLRSNEEDVENEHDTNFEDLAEHHSKLCVSLNVMHECFEPITEPRTKKDLISEVIFNRGSQQHHMNFRGFYTMILEKGEELTTVATVRIHGNRAAEMPLIGTRSDYRYKGMCRLLVNELEKLLSSLGVERLILPAVEELKETWINRFGFKEITPEERSKMLDMSVLGFPFTYLLQKPLTFEDPKNDTVVDTSEVPEQVECKPLVCDANMDTCKDDVKNSKSTRTTPWSVAMDAVIPGCGLPSNSHGVFGLHNTTGQDKSIDNACSQMSKSHQLSDSSGALKTTQNSQDLVTEAPHHIGGCASDGDVDDELVVVATTRSNRLVRQVRRKVAYSYHRSESKAAHLEQHQSIGRNNLKTKRKGECFKLSEYRPFEMEDADGIFAQNASWTKDSLFSEKGSAKKRERRNDHNVVNGEESISDASCFPIRRSSSNVFSESKDSKEITFRTGSADLFENNFCASDASETQAQCSHLAECDLHHDEVECKGSLPLLNCPNAFKFVYSRRKKQPYAVNELSRKACTVLAV